VGVDRAAIAADYALSEERLRPRELEWLDGAMNDAERVQIRERSRTPARAILSVLEELEHRHGSVEHYLRAAGVTDGDFERIRARLVR
jgi:hypothetical protein